jgi:mono/diheme cytochrome c family protein
VTPCCPMARAVRLVGGIVVLFGALLIGGCELDGYPEDLQYPVRTDPLAIKTADKDAPEYDRPGQFPDLFVGLDTEEKDKLLLDPAKLTADQRQQLERLLNESFGTPSRPQVEGTSAAARELLLKLRSELKLDQDTLARGSVLYRQNCLHCHGLTGDGHGATAPWVNPHPRDYREGRFKFTSSAQEEGDRKPRREDLVRTVYEGIDGTSMPSFRLLPDDDLEALVSYVIHLSIRGDTEYSVMRLVLTGDGDQSIEEAFDAFLQQKTKQWSDAQTTPIQPGSYPEFKTEEERDRYLQASIQRGMGLFNRPKPEGSLKSAGCLGCHTDYGRQAPHKYDYWGTIVRPADLTTGIFRGGRRPIDLYYRIHSGINGVTMPASSNNLTSEEIWDIVNFLEVLPYPRMLEKYGVKLEQ